MLILRHILCGGFSVNTPVHNFLLKYSQLGAVRCHMPGGKGLDSPLDITEIDGADSLYESAGIIRESEKNAAELFGAGDTLYSCSGSTLAIQTMLAAVQPITGRSRIALGRYCHKSAASACGLLGLDITWLYPDSFLGTVISPEAVEAAIDGETGAVFLNSVDYYGGTADIAAIAEVCREKNVLLLVDNAHGAYRVFTENHPITLGADMTADSAHKTLPALTGAAYLHLKNPAHRDLCKRQMSLFGTSSPSYLIMDSLDLCNAFITEKSGRAEEAFGKTRELKKTLKRLGYVLYDSDPMRVTVDAAAYGYSGFSLAEELRRRGAECEMCDERYTVLLFSVVQPGADFERLTRIFTDIPQKPPVRVEPHEILHPKKAMGVREALFSPHETVDIRRAAGKICGEIFSPCPPCVPLVTPGEVIDKSCVRELLRYGAEKIGIVKI